VTPLDRIVQATSDPLIKALDEAVSEGSAAARLDETLERVQQRLAAGEGPMAWEPVPLSVFGARLPDSIRSSWVFVIRAGADTGAERHPNSHQRSLSLLGTGTFEVREAERWSPHPLVSASDAALEDRWVTIPPNVWHRLFVGDRPWGMLSFHTVAAEELIEERPADPRDLDGAVARQLYEGRE
jgi:hypothetical protein